MPLVAVAEGGGDSPTIRTKLPWSVSFNRQSKRRRRSADHIPEHSHKINLPKYPKLRRRLHLPLRSRLAGSPENLSPASRATKVAGLRPSAVVGVLAFHIRNPSRNPSQTTSSYKAPSGRRRRRRSFSIPPMRDPLKIQRSFCVLQRWQGCALPTVPE